MTKSLIGCAVCAHKEGEPAVNMWCERCKPDYLSMMGGCYSLNDGHPA